MTITIFYLKVVKLILLTKLVFALRMAVSLRQLIHCFMKTYSKIYRKTLLGQAFFYTLRDLLEERTINENELELLLNVFDQTVEETFEAKSNNQKMEIRGELVEFRNKDSAWVVTASDIEIFKDKNIIDLCKVLHMFGIEEN